MQIALIKRKKLLDTIFKTSAANELASAQNKTKDNQDADER